MADVCNLQASPATAAGQEAPTLERAPDAPRQRKAEIRAAATIARFKACRDVPAMWRLVDKLIPLRRELLKSHPKLDKAIVRQNC
jgi:hypothetical protein